MSEKLDTNPENILKLYNIIIDEHILKVILLKIKNEHKLDINVCKILNYLSDELNNSKCDKLSNRYKICGKLVFVNT